MNASARVTMKDAANCDKQCELQNSVNHQIFERTLRPRVFPEGMSGLSVCSTFRACPGVVNIPLHGGVFFLCTSELVAERQHATDALKIYGSVVRKKARTHDVHLNVEREGASAFFSFYFMCGCVFSALFSPSILYSLYFVVVLHYD